jgi:hypothetical protein
MKNKRFLLFAGLLAAVLLLVAFAPIYQSIRYSQFDSIRVQHYLRVEDDADLNGDLDVDGTTNLDAMDIDGATTLNSTLDVDGNVSSGTGAFTITDAVIVTGTLDIQGGDITLANDETIGNSNDGFVDFSEGLLYGTISITATNGQTITPTYTIYRINAAGAVTITLAACSADSQPLLLYGEDAQTITVADTNIRTTDGNALGFNQYDIVEMICINSEWNLVAESNNQ